MATRIQLTGRTYRISVPVLVASMALTLSCSKTAGQVEATATETQGAVPSDPLVDTTLVELFQQGVTYEAFVEAADRRVDEWRENTARARVSPELLDRASEVAGDWRILAVAEDWCGDSAAQLPYVAHLAARLPNLELRIVDSEVGRAVMDARPTPDGRGATPTFVILDDTGQEQGCFVERPHELQEWFLANPDDLEENALYRAKYAWYDEDAGQSTLQEIIQALESAGDGLGQCPATP